MYRSALAFLVAFAVVLVVAACGSSHAATSPSFPHRIVSLSPTATEDLFAIGAGKQVVAVDADSNYPASAPQTKLSGYTPNVEAIAKYKPDLVVVSYDPHGFVSQLKKLGIKVLTQPGASDLSQAYAEIRQLGRLTGHVQQATSVVHSMQSQMKAIVASVPAAKRHLSVYHELDQTYYSATSSTFIGSIYKLFGFKNIADGAGTSSGYPQLSAEYILKQDPQIIVLADTKCCSQSAATVAARPGWSTLSAVKDKRVIGVNDDIASRWGPRIVQFARAVAEIAKKG